MIKLFEQFGESIKYNNNLIEDVRELALEYLDLRYVVRIDIDYQSIGFLSHIKTLYIGQYNDRVRDYNDELPPNGHYIYYIHIYRNHPTYRVMRLPSKEVVRRLKIIYPEEDIITY